MSHIRTIQYDTASPEQKALFDAIQGQLGMVPNFLKIFANSPAALRAFLNLHSIAGQGSLDALARERIALAVAQQNACEYCVSAHTAIGRKAGLGKDEISANRSRSSQGAKAAVAVRFSRSLVENSGDVSTADLLEMRNAGYTDAEIVEVITLVGMNFLTNLIGKVSQMDIDFPRVGNRMAVCAASGWASRVCARVRQQDHWLC